MKAIIFILRINEIIIQNIISDTIILSHSHINKSPIPNLSWILRIVLEKIFNKRQIKPISRFPNYGIRRLFQPEHQLSRKRSPIVTPRYRKKFGTEIRECYSRVLSAIPIANCRHFFGFAETAWRLRQAKMAFHIKDFHHQILDDLFTEFGHCEKYEIIIYSSKTITKRRCFLSILPNVPTIANEIIFTTIY